MNSITAKYCPVNAREVNYRFVKDDRSTVSEIL